MWSRLRELQRVFGHEPDFGKRPAPWEVEGTEGESISVCGFLPSHLEISKSKLDRRAWLDSRR
jgi:hypothetical protein